MKFGEKIKEQRKKGQAQANMILEQAAALFAGGELSTTTMIVESSFRLDPYDGALFVFCSRNRDRIKILEWDGGGFWLYFKRLEKGRFRWPTPGDDDTMSLTGEELSYLLGGNRIELKLRRNEVFERKFPEKIYQ